MKGPHASKQFRESERLDQIVVRTGVETAYAIFDRSFGRQNEHRHSVTASTELTEGLQTALPRQHEI